MKERLKWVSKIDFYFMGVFFIEIQIDLFGVKLADSCAEMDL